MKATQTQFQDHRLPSAEAASDLLPETDQNFKATRYVGYFLSQDIPHFDEGNITVWAANAVKVNCMPCFEISES